MASKSQANFAVGGMGRACFKGAPAEVKTKGWREAEFERALTKDGLVPLAMLKDRIVLADGGGLEKALWRGEGNRKPREIGDRC